MENTDLHYLINRYQFNDKKHLKTEIRNTMFLRYLLGIIAILFCGIFRRQLPFPYPHLLLVACAFLVLNGTLYLLSIHKQLTRRIHASLPYTDMLIAPLVFLYTGGFLSPFLPIHMLTAICSVLVYTNNRHLSKHISVYLLVSYLAVAFLQKYGLLANGVGYSRAMMENTFFFYFIVSNTSILIGTGVLLVEVLRRNLYQTLDEFTRSFDSIIKGTTAPTSAHFFNNLVQCISTTFDVRCVMAAEIEPMDQRLQTLAVWNEGRLESNYTVPLVSTLAHAIIGHPGCDLFDPSLVNSYPDDPIASLFPITFISGMPLIDSSGQSIGVLLVLNDTPMKTLHLLDSLFPIFASRATVEIERKRADEKRAQAEHQLAHARKMEAIGQLAGGIAHDFNNIITAIGGYASLIKKKAAANEHSMKYVEHIINAGKHASIMINQLSLFVKNGKPRIEPIDVHDIIQKSIAMLQSNLSSNITLSTDLKANPMTTFGDPTLLQNVFINLAINARDACEGREGLVSFATETVTIESSNTLCRTFSIGPGRYIRAIVGDNGCGMSQEMIEHIFEPYYTTKSKEKGSGLGLANVWRYIETFRGAIEVRSKSGQGTTFFLYLPLLNVLAPQTLETPRGADVITPHQPAQQTILIADDEPSVREIYSEILADKGYKIYTCCDGREVIEFFESRNIPVDLVLLDVIMPNINGLDAFNVIRKLHPKMKILMMSGLTDQDKIDTLLNEPDTGFFQKPCDDELLVSNIRSMLVS